MSNDDKCRATPAANIGRSDPISLLEVYRIDDAKRRLGWSDSALRAAKRRGLRLLASGKRRYVTGKEILRFLQSTNGVS